MKNILAKRSISKIFILALIFIGIIGALSVVNAAEEAINLIVGQTVEKNPGFTSLWGGYNGSSFSKGVKCISGDKSIVQMSTSGTDMKLYKDKVNIKFKAVKAGNCKIQVEYYPSMWASKETKVYNINVEEVKPKEIKVVKKPLKDVYNVGEKIDLKGLLLYVTNNNGTEANSPKIDELKFTPTVAPDVGGGKVPVTVEYKGIKTTFEIHVNAVKNNDKGNTNTNTSTNTKPNTNTNTTTKPTTNASTTAPQYSDAKAVKKDDFIKMTKGNAWKIYSDSSCENVKGYIKVSEGLTYKVESISGNIVKLSQAGKEVGYIKWYNSSTGAMSYFSKVENASQNNNTAEKQETATGNNLNTEKQEAATGNNTSIVKPEVTTEAVSEILNLMTKLVSTILKSILQCVTTVK